MRNRQILFSNKNWIKAYIVDVLPCLSISYFILAFVYNDAFFSSFGIDFLHYSTIGDIFLTISGPLISFALLTAVLMFMVSYILFESLPEAIERRKNLNMSSRYKFKSLRYIAKLHKKKYGDLITLIRKKDVEKQNGDSFLSILIIHLIYFFICTLFFYALLNEKKINPSLSIASYALIIPFFGFIGFKLSHFSLNTVISYEITIKELRNTPKIISFFICFYLYALIVFSGIGFRSASIVKNDGMCKFEIVTTNNKTYNELYYGYIGRINEYTFLFNRKNNHNIVLNNEGIVNIEINGNETIEQSFFKSIDNFFSSFINESP